MAITCHDWRECSADEAQALLSAEASAWHRELGWNVESSWRAIEPARAAGSLPGLVARDVNGRIAGWTWFINHKGCLQVAGLVAAERDAVVALVDGIMDSPEARASDARVMSVRGHNLPGLADTLTAYGFHTAEYRYQIATLDRDHKAARTGRAWQIPDIEAGAALCHRAYEPSGVARGFAPRGTKAEWREYLLTLFGTDGCGTMMPEASAVVDGTDGLAAGIITSMIDRDVAHIPQIMVDPTVQGRGVGAGLVRWAMTMAVQQGARRITLLVAAENARALSVYEKLGFKDCASFLVASSVDPVATAKTHAKRQLTTRN